MTDLEVVLSADAEDDIVEIARYTRQRWGGAQQVRYLDALERLLAELTDPLTPSRSRTDIGPNVRARLFRRSYWVYFEITGRTVRILRILHVSRRQKEAFDRTEPRGRGGRRGEDP